MEDQHKAAKMICPICNKEIAKHGDYYYHVVEGTCREPYTAQDMQLVYTVIERLEIHVVQLSDELRELSDLAGRVHPFDNAFHQNLHRSVKKAKQLLSNA